MDPSCRCLLQYSFILEFVGNKFKLVHVGEHVPLVYPLVNLRIAFTGRLQASPCLVVALLKYYHQVTSF